MGLWEGLFFVGTFCFLLFISLGLFVCVFWAVFSCWWSMCPQCGRLSHSGLFSFSWFFMVFWAVSGSGSL